jgi:hypothetical protein
VDLDHALGQIDPDSGNLVHGLPLSQWLQIDDPHHQSWRLDAVGQKVGSPFVFVRADLLRQSAIARHFILDQLRFASAGGSTQTLRVIFGAATQANRTPARAIAASGSASRERRRPA